MSFPLLIISGPSGVGKTVMIQHVRRTLPQLQIGVTYTTRPRRPGKKEDKIMRYISHEQFKQMIKRNALLEYALVHDHYYGTSRHEISKRLERGPVLLNLDVQGALQVKKQMPLAHLIFIQPGSWPELRKRIMRRGAIAPSELQLRLKNARHELRYKHRYEYKVTNNEGKLPQAVFQLTEIIRTILEKMPP